MKPTALFCAFAVSSAVVVGVGFSAFSYRHAYNKLQDKFARFERQYQDERAMLSERASLSYGIVASVDARGLSFTVALPGQTFLSDETVFLPVEVRDSTVFVQQSLLRESDAYVGFSEAVKGDISSLVPGMRVGIELRRDPETNRPWALAVLYGGTL
jgi:hypothetical protein